MSPLSNISSPLLEARGWQEIPRDELHQYAFRLRETLEVICGSTAFQTSPKSCEFLRHIVLRTLDGETDALKERLIGMMLLRRDASYDTSTDAGVRVRANDVRKRLTAYNEGQAQENQTHNTGFSFKLPPGTYVPLFFRYAADPQPPDVSDVTDALPQEPAPRLSLYQLALPTLAALFLCVICVRWQFAQENSFTSFWQQVFQDDQALLCLSPSPADAGQEPVAVHELKMAARLLDLAGEFHRQFTLIGTPAQAPSSGGSLVYIGAPSEQADAFDNMPFLPGQTSSGGSIRFVARNTPAGRAIFDRNAPQPDHPLSGHVALLTIIDGTRRLIFIDGTDEAAIHMLIERLCNQNTFPRAIADSFRPGTMTQAVFPMAAPAETTIIHTLLPGTRAHLEFWR
jgi:hypothetical protein